jgi:hypothetical protein
MEEIAPRLCNDIVAMSVPAHLSRLNGGNTLFSSANWHIKAAEFALSLLFVHNCANISELSCAVTLIVIVCSVFYLSNLEFYSKFSYALNFQGMKGDSPAFQCRVKVTQRPSSEGTADWKDGQILKVPRGWQMLLFPPSVFHVHLS